MLSTIQAIIAILHLTASYSPTSKNFIEMVGYSIDEYYCKQAPKEERYKYASCAAYCASSTWWMSSTEIEFEVGDVCQVIKDNQ